MNEWWKEAVFYEAYVPSCCDGNGDGVGDLIGIVSKLDHLKELGVDGIWLTPFYKSPKVDNGYDISDYYSIDPVYGDMTLFETFIEQAHKRNMKVIIDIVLNHTSDQHPWFIESKSSLDNPKRDWYIWKDPVDNEKPNNWESFFKGSAWEYEEATKQYYYHAFSKEQVDLNWENQEVKEAMWDVLRFWLDKGVDGFRLDVINFLSIDSQLRDNPYDDNGEQLHTFDKDQPQIHGILKELNEVVHAYPDKVLVGEVGTEEFEIAKEYINDKDSLNIVFNFNLGSIEKLDIDKMYAEIDKMNKGLSKEQFPTLFFSSHDMSRHISRFGTNNNEKELAEIFCTLILTARGVPFIYNGEEFGMTDNYIDDINNMKDVQGIIAYHAAISNGIDEKEAIEIANKEGRDSSRALTQWQNAGNSTHEFYKEMIRIRREYPSLHAGEYKTLETNDEVLWYVKKNQEEILVMLNFAATNKEVKVEGCSSKSELILSNKRTNVELGNTITMQAYEILIIKMTK